MGLLDLLSKKKDRESNQVSKHTYAKNDDENAYFRKIKVAGVTYKNDDGTSRQEILADIHKKKPPFDRKLDVGIEQYEWEGKPAYYITVNGKTIGSAESSASSFITNNKERIQGIVDFWVNGGGREDGEYTPYYARVEVKVGKKHK